MQWMNVIKGIVRNVLPIASYIVVAFFLLRKEYNIYAYIIVYGVFFFILYKYRKSLTIIFRSKIVFGIYSVVVVYVSNVYAEKMINHDFLIKSENINHSSVFLGAFLSVPVTIFIISLFLIILMPLILLLPTFDAVLPPKLKGIEKKPFFYCWPYLIMALSFFLEPLNIITDSVSRASLFMDAYPVSDCGPKEDYIFYLRKDESSCYRINANFNPGKYLYEIETINEKG